MEKRFRSRGIRIEYNESNCSVTEKCYYEPDQECKISNEYINALQDKGIISLFEYSIVDNKIDTYNYHVDLLKDEYAEMYEGLSYSIIDMLKKIQDSFGKYMKNYTVGYRMNESTIVQQIFYFYPTIWNGNRYRIKGITEKAVIFNGIKNFFEFFIDEDKQTRKKVMEFADMIYKFKGISVHVSNNELSYKIYGRINYNLLKAYLSKNYSYNIDKNLKYGKCVLAALRIMNNRIQGINIYYLR